MNFLDDRTLAGATWGDVQRARREWDTFESAGGIPGNPAKTQVWGRTKGAHAELVAGGLASEETPYGL
eukprot:8068841-Alexandrium_andersonii.AAC.1